MLKFRRYILTGLVVFLPLSLTVYLLIMLVNFTDGLLGKYLEPYFVERVGFYVHGIGILVGLLILFIIGFFSSNFLGKRIYGFFENLILKLPFFRQIYPAIKEMAIFLFSREKLAFKQVVVIEYPRKGLYSYGFLTNDSSHQMQEKLGKELCNVFIPSAPGPLTGYVLMVPKRDIIFTDVSVEEAIKFIVSGGVVNPY